MPRYRIPLGNKIAAKLTRENVVEILSLIAAGMKLCAIARRYGCCKENISSIKRGVTWKDVPR